MTGTPPPAPPQPLSPAELAAAADDPAAADEAIDQRARQVVALLTRLGRTLATAESLTGGLVGAAITSVPGASHVYRGGVVSYATDLKHLLLGVDAGLLAQVGPVDAEVAEAMADGVRSRLTADVGLATTGVAGPEPQDGKAPGTVWIGVSTPWRTCHVAASLGVGDPSPPIPDRTTVRRVSVLQALTYLAAVVGEGDVPSMSPG